MKVRIGPVRRPPQSAYRNTGAQKANCDMSMHSSRCGALSTGKAVAATTGRRCQKSRPECAWFAFPRKAPLNIRPKNAKPKGWGDSSVHFRANAAADQGDAQGQAQTPLRGRPKPRPSPSMKTPPTVFTSRAARSKRPERSLERRSTGLSQVIEKVPCKTETKN